MRRERPTFALLALLLFLSAGGASAHAQGQERDRLPTVESTTAQAQPSAQPSRGDGGGGGDGGSGSTTTLAFVALGALTLLALAAVVRRGRAGERAAPAAVPAPAAPAAPPDVRPAPPEAGAAGQDARAAAPAVPPVPSPPPPTGGPELGRDGEPEPTRSSAPESTSEPEPPEPKPEPAPAAAGQAIGYTTFAGNEGATGLETQRIGRRLEEACEERGLVLKKLVGDVESASGAALNRPGLLHAQDLLSSGQAHCLMVESLDQLSRSAGTLGELIGWLAEHDVRVVVLDIDLDTSSDKGRLAAEALVTVGELERRRLEQRTRKGLEAAREGRVVSGRPAVADKPSLKRRIAEMRAGGMTLQAIADVLNAEGVPTLRGGAEWRPSSVQAAAGYKRPSRRSKPQPDEDL